jgi:hypothetical protein
MIASPAPTAARRDPCATTPTGRSSRASSTARIWSRSGASATRPIRTFGAGVASSSRARRPAWSGAPTREDDAKTPWSEASARLLPTGGRVAVPGGQGVFDLFLAIGYDAFHLTRAHGVRLGAGRRLFSACDAGYSAEAVLRGAGLEPDPPVTIDAKADVALTVWRRQAPAAVRTATPWPA